MRIYFTILFTLLFALTAQAQNTEIETLQEKLNQGENQEAVEFAGELLSKDSWSDSDKASIHYWRALGYYNLASSIDAEANPERFPEIVENLLNTKDDLLIARTLAEGEDAKTINKTINDLWMVFFSNAQQVVNHLWQTGDIKSVGNDYEAAYAYLNAAIEIKPNYRAYDKLANLDEVSGKYKEAYENYKMAFELFNKKEFETVDFGIALLGMKIADFEAYYFDTNPNEEDYIGDLKAALSTIQKTEDKLFSEMMKVVMQSENPEEADQLMEQYYEYDDLLTLWKIDLWSMAWNQGFPTKQEFEKKLEKDSLDYFLNVAYGDLLMLEDNTWGAIEYYEKASEINPLIAYAFYRLGENYAALGSSPFSGGMQEEQILYNKALDAYERIYELDPENPEVVQILINISSLAVNPQKRKMYEEIYDKLPKGN